MNCSEVESRMMDWLDNTLEEGLRKDIESHLVNCERCLDELKDVKQVMQFIANQEEAKPDDSLRINFYHMLHREIQKNEKRNTLTPPKPPIRWFDNRAAIIAAAFALIICGTFLGAFIQSKIINSNPANQLKQLQSEVSDLKKAVMFTMLNEESSSNRIQAVNYADELANPDKKVIDVLVRTLNQDKNVNVRMAAAYALAKFADQGYVCDSLVTSLSRQEDPILQVTLINILVEKKVKSALKPIQQIITNKSTLKEVRNVAENGERLLI